MKRISRSTGWRVLAFISTTVALQVVLLQAAAWAQAYPTRPVRLIVPFPPGGSTDIYARIISPRLGAALGQQVVVDNRAGAGGAIGAELAAAAPPDGYTIWLGQTNTHVPYKGAAPALIDLRGGRITYLATSLASAAAFIKEGKIKAIATSGATRARLLPDVPTIAESALPGFEVTSWHGMLAPARVPHQIISRLNREIVLILGKPEVQQMLLSEGGEIAPSTPEEFAAFLRSEVAKWAKVLKQAGVTLN